MAISVTEQYSGSVEASDLEAVAIRRSGGQIIAEVKFMCGGEYRTLTFNCPGDLKNQVVSLAIQAVSDALGL